MRKVFYDEQLQAEFERNGYIILQLFSHNQIIELIELYENVDGVKGTANTNKNTYELSFFEKDAQAKRKKFDIIYNFVKPFLEKVLVHYSPLIVNLFNKEQGTGEVPIHQNWTFVDEKKYTSVSVWCPLQNVSRENGTLEVVPGTQKVISDFRGPFVPWVFDKLNDVMKEKYMVPLNLQLGQVGVIDDSLIHYSGINFTSKQRRAIQLILKPDEAQTIHCYKENEEEDIVTIMEIDDDYFFDFDMWRKPTGGRNKFTIHFPIHKITEIELVGLFNKNLQS